MKIDALAYSDDFLYTDKLDQADPISDKVFFECDLYEAIYCGSTYADIV